MITFLATFLALALAQGTPPEYDASSLPKVTGPRPPNYPDPAPRYTGTGMDAYIRRMSRRGLVEAVTLPDGDVTIKDKIEAPAGWKAYQAKVPAGQTVKVRLKSDHEPWFVVRAVNRVGLYEKGMMPHSLHTCDPMTTYVNSSKETKTVFFIVDTTELNVGLVPYSLHITIEETANATKK